MGPPGTVIVSVDPGTRDKYGLPVAAISIVRHPTDFKMTRFLVERGEEILQAMNPESVERLGDNGETLILQGGTCRFGKDPATSVLDKDCRAHEVDNLYVVDGSFMPSIGAVNPTLTIIANALRVGDHIAGRLGTTGTTP